MVMWDKSLMLQLADHQTNMTDLVRGEETLHLILQTEEEYSLKIVYSKGERKSPVIPRGPLEPFVITLRIVVDSSSLSLRLARPCI